MIEFLPIRSPPLVREAECGTVSVEAMNPQAPLSKRFPGLAVIRVSRKRHIAVQCEFADR